MSRVVNEASPSTNEMGQSPSSPLSATRGFRISIKQIFRQWGSTTIPEESSNSVSACSQKRSGSMCKVNEEVEMDKKNIISKVLKTAHVRCVEAWTGMGAVEKGGVAWLQGTHRRRIDSVLVGGTFGQGGKGGVQGGLESWPGS